MKKLLLILSFSIAFASLAFTQTSADSVAIVSIQWDIQKVRKGVKWKSAQTEIYNAPQMINILEIKPRKKNQLGIAYCVDTLITTSSLCRQANASAGVNASFFDMKNGGSVDYMRVDGKDIHKGRESSTNSNGAIVVDKQNVTIVRTNSKGEGLEGSNILVTGPMLVSSSTVEAFPENSFNLSRHPRTCVAVTNKGTILLVTVDGRHKDKAEGMSTKELAYLVKILGAKDAVNFDGGGSTTMYIKGYGENGIVSYPSDNRTFDRKGERPVANVVYLK